MIVRIRWTYKRREPRSWSALRQRAALGVLLLAPTVPLYTDSASPEALLVVSPPRPINASPAMIERFMQRYDFPRPHYVREIVEAAERASVPPSLIVCIEFRESSGGKYYDEATHNPLGWANGNASFPSELAAIRYVTEQLGSGRFYIGKTLEEKLHMYNPRPQYTAKVLDCMNEISGLP